MSRLALSLVVLLAAASPLKAVAAPTRAELHKNPECSCCDEHARYLGKNGFEVTVIEDEQLTAFKAKHGVPASLEGCHTTLIDGYVVEGHVPVSAIHRLLRERPKLRGIAVPGMPAGSPGMGGTRTEPLVSYELKEGEPAVFAVE